MSKIATHKYIIDNINDAYVSGNVSSNISSEQNRGITKSRLIKDCGLDVCNIEGLIDNNGDGYTEHIPENPTYKTTDMILEHKPYSDNQLIREKDIIYSFNTVVQNENTMMDWDGNEIQTSSTFNIYPINYVKQNKLVIDTPTTMLLNSPTVGGLTFNFYEDEYDYIDEYDYDVLNISVLNSSGTLNPDLPIIPINEDISTAAFDSNLTISNNDLWINGLKTINASYGTGLTVGEFTNSSEYTRKQIIQHILRSKMLHMYYGPNTPTYSITQVIAGLPRQMTVGEVYTPEIRYVCTTSKGTTSIPINPKALRFGTPSNSRIRIDENNNVVAVSPGSANVQISFMDLRGVIHLLTHYFTVN